MSKETQVVNVVTTQRTAKKFKGVFVLCFFFFLVGSVYLIVDYSDEMKQSADTTATAKANKERKQAIDSLKETTHRLHVASQRAKPEAEMKPMKTLPDSAKNIKTR